MAEALASPSQQVALRLVPRAEGLTFDEYLAILRAHHKPKLLGPLKILVMRVKGVRTWRVAPPWAGTEEPHFCLELDRPARFMTADELGWDDDEGPATTDAHRGRWLIRGRLSRPTLRFTLRTQRQPMLRADRERMELPLLDRAAEEMSVEDFRILLRRRPDFHAEMLALARAEHAVEVAAEGEPPISRQAEERAALQQQPRYRTPDQRALVAAFNKRAAAARVADKKGKHD